MKIKKFNKLSTKLFSLLIIGGSLSNVSAYGYDSCDWYKGNIKDSTSYDLSIQVPNYISIAIDSSSVLSASTATITNNGNTLILGNDLSLVYNIQSSVNAGVMISSPNMIDRNDNNKAYLVFAKDGATESAISKSTPDYTVNDNPNAIAFEIRANTPTATVGTAPSVNYHQLYDYDSVGHHEGFIYTIEPGSSTISLTVDAASATNTYGPNDTKGEYTASIVVTKIEDWSFYRD